MTLRRGVKPRAASPGGRRRRVRRARLVALEPEGSRRGAASRSTSPRSDAPAGGGLFRHRRVLLRRPCPSRRWRVLTSFSAADWLCAPVAISLIRPLICKIIVTMPASVSPVSDTSLTPCATCSADSEISALICLAASADLCARPRTSEATTAKPRPASPARAASTPALSARRLVWKAISSMTPMICPILRDEALIRSIASVVLRTISLLFSASTPAPLAAALASLTLSEALAAVSATPPSVAVACSSAAACCSVRRERSSDAAAISRPAMSTRLTLCDTSVSVAFRLPCVELKLSRRGSNISWNCVAIGAERSLPASRDMPSPNTARSEKLAPYLTILTTRPLRSQIGLYEACSSTSRPPLPSRRKVAMMGCPALSLRQNSAYSAEAA